MRSEIGVTPYANYYIPYLNGERLEHCRMADEELGCAEVYQVDEQGHRRPEWGTRMLFGQIEIRPVSGLDPMHKPADAAAIDARRREWDEIGKEVKAKAERHRERIYQWSTRFPRD